MSCDEIRIGALYPFDKDNRQISQSVRQVMELYVDIINHQRQIPTLSDLEVPYLNSKIELIWANTEGDSLVGISEAKRLIEEEGVTSLIGSYQSTVTEAISLQTEVLKIPYLSPDTDAEMLTQRGLKWFFRTGPTDVIFTKAYFDMMKELGYSHSTLGALSENSLLGQDEVLAVINLSRWYRHRVTAMELYDPNLPITKQKILNIKEANPDFLFTCQYLEAIIQTIRIMKELKYYPKAIFSQIGSYSNEDNMKILGKYGNYVFSATVWAEGLTKKILLARKFNNLYRAKYGENLNSVNSRSFTGLYTLIDAIARAGSSNPEAIREALAATNISGNRLILPWRGIQFDRTGQNIFADSMIVQTINEIPKIVWPQNLAQTKPIIPAKPWFRD